MRTNNGWGSKAIYWQKRTGEATKCNAFSKGGASNGTYYLGAIAKEIGTGEHAKDSFIWMTLKYCFYLGAIFSVVLLLVFCHFSFDRNEPEKFDIISALKDVWSIFTPILTLALGYAFGKREV